MNLLRTNSRNKEFMDLVKQLDVYLAEKDGEDHAFYDHFNRIDALNQVIIAYDNNKAVGCGAIKEFSPEAVEIKRMFTLPESRGLGIASGILRELENWAKELKYGKCILETGLKQTEAIQLYQKSGYGLIPNYGQYKGIENSRCFEKLL